MQIFFLFSLLCIATAAACFVVALINKAVTPPPNFRIPPFIAKIGFLKYSFAATMISIALTVCYASFTVFYAMKLFENTQCTEVIFFLGFLTGCLCEGMRFLTPLFGLWATFSDLLFFCGRLIFAGRLLCPLSFVFAAILSAAGQRQDVERNILMLFGICIVFSVIAPINTARITSSGAVTWGFPALFYFSKVLFIAIAFISFRIKAAEQNASEYKTISVSMLALMAGYGILVNADNYVFMAAGFPLLLAGTQKYLKTLHSLYMWK